MQKDMGGSLKARFRDFANGAGLPRGRHDFGTAIQGAIREGLLTKEAAAQHLGVQPAHVYSKANALKPSEIRDFCQKLTL